jgi:hypothetical protein
LRRWKLKVYLFEESIEDRCEDPPNPARTMSSLHSTISVTIKNILTYCESNNIDVKGMTNSIIGGVGIGFTILLLLSFFPGEQITNIECQMMAD